MTIKIENYNDIYADHKRHGSRWSKEIFPYSQKYIENPEFEDDDWDSFYVDGCNCPVAITILRDSPVIRNTLHISLLEVAEPIKRMGYGLQVLNKIIDLANTHGYRYITLRTACPELENFYGQAGFQRWRGDEMLLEL